MKHKKDIRIAWSQKKKKYTAYFAEEFPVIQASSKDPQRALKGLLRAEKIRKKHYENN
jgi:hypothetical protein